MGTRGLGVTAVLAAMILPTGCGEGSVEVLQDIQLETEWMDFGELAAGESATLTAKIHNAGDQELVFEPAISVVDERGDGAFAVDAPFTSIPPREFAEITVTYTPADSMYSYGYVALYSNDPDEPFRFLVLQGVCPPVFARATVQPSVVDFGWVTPGEVGEQAVEVRNTGELPVTIADVAIGGSSEQFQVPEWPEHPIQPGETALVPVQFVSDTGDQTLGSMTIELADVGFPAYAVSLSANTPHSPDNAPPHITLLQPTRPEEVYIHQDWVVEAEVFDLQPGENGMYCTLDSSVMGGVEQDIADPDTGLLTMVVDVYNEDISDPQLVDFPGIHTMELCCYDVFTASSCVTFVVSVTDPLPADDADGDGYGVADGDCDDGDPTAYPGALEELDGVDDDCDGEVDDETTMFDDDGDGASEDDGDCDDGDPGIHPDAEEEGDFVDEDCDGTIDEGTVTVDDDGDGFAESVGDCDDADPDVFQGAPEWCDTLDNDCDGEADEECIDTSCPLVILGLASATRVPPGAEVELALTVISCSEAELVYDWGADGGEFAFPGGEPGAAATWIAPDEIGKYSVFCELTDPATDESEWAFVEIEVVRSDPTVATSSGASCELARGGGGGGPALAAVLLALTLATRRRP